MVVGSGVHVEQVVTDAPGEVDEQPAIATFAHVHHALEHGHSLSRRPGRSTLGHDDDFVKS